MSVEFTEWLSTPDICAWFIIAVTIVSWICGALVGITTPYGRYACGRSGWGFEVNAKVAWFVQESPSFLIPFTLMLINTRHKFFSPNVLLLCLFLLHYFRRYCQTTRLMLTLFSKVFIYPFTMKKTTPTPFGIAAFAFAFCTMNGYMQGWYLLQIARYDSSWFYSPCFLIGTFLFFVGFTINVHSDYIVTNLRNPRERGHKIPRGGLYEYVSGANFFGEIVEWGGFALACFSFVGLAFFASTLVNIGIRACHHHRFYLEKFEDYPKDRKAIIPFIF